VRFMIKDSPCYIGLNKNEPQLLAAVDAIIAEAKKDGALAAISEKWLGAPLPAGL
jgi:polar amino acid transport system substrate-binding protein